MGFSRRGGVTFKFLAAMLVAFCLGVGSASADVTEVPLESPTAGITVGPDGNIWAVELVADQVVRISPTGAVLARYPLAGEPEGVTAGPGGRVWVAVDGSLELVWFDALAPAPSAHPISTMGVSKCGPVAIVYGGDGFIYFSAPSADGMCNGGVSAIGRVAADGTGAVKGLAGAGEAFGLAALGGKLFVPDFGGDVVRRVAGASFGLEATIAVPGDSGPGSVAVSPSGEIWTSLFNSSQVTRFPAAQNGGSAAVLPLAPGVLSEPGGI
jgi:streptogramin lyase